jgi:hypothetical protein
MDEDNQINQESLEKQKLEQLGNEVEGIGNKTTQETPPSSNQPTQQPDTLQPVSPSSSVEVKPQRLSKSKGILWIGVALMVLALVGVGAYYLGFRKTASFSAPEPTPTQTPTSTPDPTADWKTYKNSELSFKYPQDWTTEEIRIIGTNPEVIISVATKDSSLMTECMKLDTTEKESKFVIKKFSRITTGEMCSTSDSSPREIWVVPTEDDYSPGISYRYTSKDNPEAENILNQILSTFEFIEEQAFVCPELKTIDCMPSVDGPLAKYCAPDYAEWIGENCLDVGIVY